MSIVQANFSTRARNGLRALRRDKSGNVMLLAGLAMPIMVGGVGLGVDTAQWYLWKRELQFATDQAALAGAYAKASGNSAWESRVINQVAQNKTVAAFAQVTAVTASNDGFGTNNAVDVTVEGAKDLPFSGMFLDDPFTMTVASKSVYTPPISSTTNRSCLTGLNTSGKAVEISGSTLVNIGCEIESLSTSSNSVDVSGSVTWGSSTMSITTKGGISGATVPSIVTQTTNSTTISNPFTGLTSPTSNGTATAATSCPSSGSRTLNPGTFSGLSLSCNTVLNAGIYVINGGTFSLNAASNIDGTAGVMFVLKNGAKLSWSGGTGNVDLRAPSAAQLTSWGKSTSLADMLVFSDPTTGSTEDQSLAGSTGSAYNMKLSGAIYIPRAKLNLSGRLTSSTTACVQLAGKYTVTTGGTYLSSLCPTGITPTYGSGGASTPAKIQLVA